ncbi:hypothetical protein [Streptomyces sp. NPDC002054]|uniref:hypothetical protein n=1 Tax=Streptomyces sp. NPDC002054 TaxID=3154663 RepID=UPI00332A65CE
MPDLPRLLLLPALLIAGIWFRSQNMMACLILTVLLGVGLVSSVLRRRLAADPSAAQVASPRMTFFDMGCMGLVAAVVFVPIILVADRPWNAPWWPGRHEASQLPDPCAAGAAAAVRLTPAGIAERKDGNGGYGPGSSCVWRDDENGGTLWLEYVRGEWEGSFGGSATAKARKQHALNLRGAEGRTSRTITLDGLDGVSDEALRVWQPGGDVTVLARRANVTVKVWYLPPPSTGQDPTRVDSSSFPAAEQAAREALASIKVD